MMFHAQIAQRAFNTPLLVDLSKNMAFLAGLGRASPGSKCGWRVLRSRFVYRRRGPSLLVTDAVRLNTRGQAAVSKSKTGRGQGSSGSNRSGGSIPAKNAPIFLLVQRVKLRRRLDLARDALRAVDGVSGLILTNWGEG